METKIKFRDLTKDEIELRVGATKKDQNGNYTGFQLLLYKDSRTDASILDSTVGEFNWQKKFYQVKNTMICSVGINANYNDPSKEPYWVWKDDAGDESETEAIKGEASDSFKRASGGSCWGIGRALYGAPFVWIKADQDNHPKTSHYFVSEIEYSNGEISKLVICNEKTRQVVFSCGSQYKVAQNGDLRGKNTTATPKASNDEPIREEDKTFIETYIGKLTMEQYGNFFNWLNEKFGVRNIGKLNAEQGVMVVNSLKRKGA